MQNQDEQAAIEERLSELQSDMQAQKNGNKWRMVFFLDSGKTDLSWYPSLFLTRYWIHLSAMSGKIYRVLENIAPEG